MARKKKSGWWVTTARFNGTIAGRAVMFGQHNYIYGDYLAAVWWNDSECAWTFIARDGIRGEDRSDDIAMRIATGSSIEDPEDRCPRCKQRIRG